MRLIDADALNKKLCETTIFIKDGVAFQRMIDDAPTIDAVPVVRCKECKNRYTFDCPMCVNDFYIVDSTQDDDFCYMGQRERSKK